MSPPSPHPRPLPDWDEALVRMEQALQDILARIAEPEETPPTEATFPDPALGDRLADLERAHGRAEEVAAEIEALLAASSEELSAWVGQVKELRGRRSG
jgi:hypothetical protein